MQEYPPPPGSPPKSSSDMPTFPPPPGNPPMSPLDMSNLPPPPAYDQSIVQQASGQVQLPPNYFDMKSVPNDYVL